MSLLRRLGALSPGRPLPPALTQDIIAACATHSLPLHHISRLGFLLAKHHTNEPALSAAILPATVSAVKAAALPDGTLDAQATTLLVNTLRGLTTLPSPPKGPLYQLAASLAPSLHLVDEARGAMAVAALSQMRVSTPHLLVAVCGRAEGHAGELSSDTIARLLGALTRARIPHDALFEEAAGVVSGRLADGTLNLPLTALQTLVWSFASAEGGDFEGVVGGLLRSLPSPLPPAHKVPYVVLMGALKRLAGRPGLHDDVQATALAVSKAVSASSAHPRRGSRWLTPRTATGMLSDFAAFGPQSSLSLKPLVDRVEAALEASPATFADVDLLRLMPALSALRFSRRTHPQLWASLADGVVTRGLLHSPGHLLVVSKAFHGAGWVPPALCEALVGAVEATLCDGDLHPPADAISAICMGVQGGGGPVSDLVAGVLHAAQRQTALHTRQPLLEALRQLTACGVSAPELTAAAARKHRSAPSAGLLYAVARQGTAEACPDSATLLQAALNSDSLSNTRMPATASTKLLAFVWASLLSPSIPIDASPAALHDLQALARKAK